MLINQFFIDFSYIVGPSDVDVTLEFKMDRTVRTLNDAWREWFDGFTGRPSVKAMEERYGTAWRKSPADTKFYNRRHFLIKFVQSKATQWNLNLTDTMKRIERAKEAANIKSLDALRKKIQANDFEC